MGLSKLGQDIGGGSAKEYVRRSAHFRTLAADKHKLPLVSGQGHPGLVVASIERR